MEVDAAAFDQLARCAFALGEVRQHEKINQAKTGLEFPCYDGVRQFA